MKNQPLGLLRMTAQAFLLAGIVGSFFYAIDTENNINSIILRFLFTIWVLLPLLSLLIANLLSRSWSSITRVALYLLTMLITLVSLTGYIIVLTSHMASRANISIAVPLLSWLLIATVMPIAAAKANKSRE
jgi:hypothetical protein